MLRLRANEGFTDLNGLFWLFVAVHNRRCCIWVSQRGLAGLKRLLGVCILFLLGAFGLNARALISRHKFFFPILSPIVIVRSTGPQGNMRA